ncbi:MAG: hypothetical protein ACR2K0_06340, partial [Acidimicrobiales bacterium]
DERRRIGVHPNGVPRHSAPKGPADLLLKPCARVELRVDKGGKRLHRPQRLLDLRLPWLAVFHGVVRNETVDAY